MVMSEIIINNYNGISLKKNFSPKIYQAFKKIKLIKPKIKYGKNGILLLKKFSLKKMYNLTKKFIEKIMQKKIKIAYIINHLSFFCSHILPLVEEVRDKGYIIIYFVE